jgi:putative acetyltransferase
VVAKIKGYNDNRQAFYRLIPTCNVFYFLHTWRFPVVLNNFNPNMDIHIRELKKEDNVSIAALIRKVLTEFKRNQDGTVFTDPTTDNLYDLFTTAQAKYWIAEENGQVIGGCGIYPTAELPEGCAELVKFYLDPASRGKGIGKMLMEKSFESARSMRFTQLYLESFPEFTTAISLYEKYGFQFLPEALGNSGHFACNVWMLKDL